MAPMWKKLKKLVDLESQHHLLTMNTRDVLNVIASRTKEIRPISTNVSSHEFLLLQLKSYQGGRNLTQRRWRGPTIWKDMLKHVLNGTAKWQNKKVVQPCKGSHPCLDDHHFNKEDLESFGELSKVCSHIVLKCLYFARIGRLDTLWNVIKLARGRTRRADASQTSQRRTRSFFHHEQMAVMMTVVSVQHHSAQRCCSIVTQTDEYVATSATFFNMSNDLQHQ